MQPTMSSVAAWLWRSLLRGQRRIGLFRPPIGAKMIIQADLTNMIIGG